LKSIALILALLLLHYRPRKNNIGGWYLAYTNWIQRIFNPSSRVQGVIAWLMAVGLPTALVANVYFLVLFKLGLLAALCINVVMLYFILQFSNFGKETETIYEELSAEKLDDARLSYVTWQKKPMEEYSETQLASLTIEATLIRAYSGLFAPIFWFVLLGPAGAVLYRASEQLQQKCASSSTQALHVFSKTIHQWIDWLPVRFTAISFAIVGDFEDAAYCWRNQAAQWSNKSLGILLTSAAGALDIRLADSLPDNGDDIARAEAGIGDDPGADQVQATLAMIWRVLLMVIVLVFLFIFGYWLGS
jgi:adenosylcobinamide-phosphate synthase